MNKNVVLPTESDAFQKLFAQLPEERLPQGFRSALLQEVRRRAEVKRQRAERLSWLFLLLASFALITLAVWVLTYLGLPSWSLPTLDWENCRFTLWIGAMALLLLVVDYKLRQYYFKRHAS